MSVNNNTTKKMRFSASHYVKDKNNKDNLMEIIKKAEALNIVEAVSKTPESVSSLTSFYDYLFD